MILNKIKIRDFYCYVGENVFDFSEGLNIISGSNSAGKSHLFNAFYWTFFNHLYVDISKSSFNKNWKNADHVVTLPDHVINQMDKSKIYSSEIEITLTAQNIKDFDGDDNTSYKFQKIAQFQKIGDDVIVVSNPDLEISYVVNGETEYLKKGDHDWFLTEIFPEQIRKFMWFQGETVDELYDFSSPSSLKEAIDEISYFPLYDNMSNITDLSKNSIHKKVRDQVKGRDDTSSELEALLNKLDALQEEKSTLERQIANFKIEINNLGDSITAEEEKVLGFEKYSDFKIEQNNLEHEVKKINHQLDELSDAKMRSFVSDWMVLGCEKIVNAAKDKLDIIQKEIQDIQNSDNPIPFNLPGPEYVKRMLSDHICYICERKVEEGTDAYKALESRVADFQADQELKVLSENFTQLNRAFSQTLNRFNGLEFQFTNSKNKEIDLIEERKAVRDKLKKLDSKYGINSKDKVDSITATADQIVNKIRSQQNSKKDKELRLYTSESRLVSVINEIEDLKNKQSKIQPANDVNESPEFLAKVYIDCLDEIVRKLRDKALYQLIKEIEQESNLLYDKYLGGKTQGKIVIDGGVRVVDRLTGNRLTNLNTAEITAHKLAVANSFLSLSAKKLNNSFPLLADAPTSDFDPNNTISLTKNLSGSFKQIIIMSKDYISLEDGELDDFMEQAKVSKFYTISNEKIDVDGEDSRVNKKTFINVLK